MSFPNAAPVLHVAALWLPGIQSDHVAKTLRAHVGDPPDGFQRGQVVTFSLDQADAPDFQSTLRRMNLEELNARG